MNSVLIAVLAMLILSLLRVHVVIALILGSMIGGLVAGFSIVDTVEIFTGGLGGSATVALSYALLGGFAIAISKTGLPNVVVEFAVKLVGREGESRKRSLSKVLLILVVLTISCFSQNLIPIHIAFIPILIPPLLQVFNELKIDRRAIATVITFGLKAPYILIPAGFGLIFHEIIQINMAESGLEIALSDIPKALFIPTVGMVVGLLLAVLWSYRKKREYQSVSMNEEVAVTHEPVSKRAVIVAIGAIIIALVVQYETKSMIISALAGMFVLLFSGKVSIKSAENYLTDGMKMMAFIGFVMITASGFAAVIRETGHVDSLVEQSASLIGDQKGIAAILMLLVGLFITMGIGSSFSTIPIIATLFVPLALAVGFSPLATIALIGTAAALGDAGSPASDSTLGPTAGLNADGQHNHIWDTCVPTFLHFNLPLIAFGWIAAMIL
ncbi:TRAP transporter large permease subunit [Anaerobacillus alkaliphilus]|uniref:TRAP transporter large permease subunit n=1 Tax=Anaerobacillus alkaliphilus TaxID=1548597 RepID=A0A4Q0VU61_9BACI|nr:Na+/H+ antiporter family protein [Anaerobacillus alkaliphilus]RXJ01848.1 TRAP transporter large permease subunit [Anaerobacillus alkaliphilus]